MSSIETRGRTRGRRLLRKARGLPVIALTICVLSGLLAPSASADTWNNGFLVGGKIFEEYDQNQRAGFNYGRALSREDGAHNGGKVQRFDGGNIYWHPLVSNAHANTVGGRILAKFAERDWERSPLKYPTTREIRIPGGSFNHFEGGSIYWSSATDAHIVWGAIRQKWFDTGAERYIGFPKSDENNLARYGGLYNTFERGSIYWTAATGARIVGGAIGDIWGRAGWEGGNYGYPVTDEFDIPGGKRQIFQGGPIDWYSDGRSVGLIKMSTFRWQSFIPDPYISVRCDPMYLNNEAVIGEKYDGNNRSWNPEGSFKDRQDVNVSVNQAARGAKVVSFWADTSVTHQYIDTLVGETVNTRKATAADLKQSRVSNQTGDWPDVVRFKIDSLSTQPFCDAPFVDDGIRAAFTAGFSASRGAFFVDGWRRAMPNGEAYIRDWVTPGKNQWVTVGRWNLTGPSCLIGDTTLCPQQDMKVSSANWNNGRVTP